MNIKLILHDFARFLVLRWIRDIINAIEPVIVVVLKALHQVPRLVCVFLDSVIAKVAYDRSSFLGQALLVALAVLVLSISVPIDVTIRL